MNSAAFETTDWIDSLCSLGIDFALFSDVGSEEIQMVVALDVAGGHIESRFVLAPFAPGSKPLAIVGEHFSTTKTVKSFASVLIRQYGAKTQPTDPPCSTVATRDEIDLFNDSSKENYARAFGEFHSALEEGRFQKLVLSRPHKVARNRSLTRFFHSLVESYPHSYRFLVKAGEKIYGGATPEILCRKRGRRATIMSLAGTMPRNDRNSYDWSDKNIKEQAVVTSFILDSIAPLADDIKTSGPKTCLAGPVVHILTDIRADLKNDVSLWELIDALHPTPAVCGLPQKEARDFILEHEGWDRGFYTGYLGLIKGQDADLFVNLRSAVIDGPVACCFGGGGLLKASELEDEWKETERKISTLKGFL